MDNYWIFNLILTNTKESIESWHLDEVLVAVHVLDVDGASVVVGVLDVLHTVLAEPRLAVPDVLSCGGHLEADEVLTTVVFEDELPGEVVEQSAQFDVGTSAIGLVGSRSEVVELLLPRVGGELGRVVALGHVILVVSVVVAASALEVSQRAHGSSGVGRNLEGLGVAALEGACANHVHEVDGVALLVGACSLQTKGTLGSHHVGIGQTEEVDVVAPRAIGARDDFEFHVAIALKHIDARVIDTVNLLGVGDVDGAFEVSLGRGEGVARLGAALLGVGILLVVGPGVVETGVVGVIGVDELGDAGAAVPAGVGEAIGCCASRDEALADGVVVRGVGLVEGDGEDALRAARQVGTKVVLEVGLEGVATVVDDVLHHQFALLVPLVGDAAAIAVAALLTVAQFVSRDDVLEPGVVVEVHLGENHVGHEAVGVAIDVLCAQVVADGQQLALHPVEHVAGVGLRGQIASLLLLVGTRQQGYPAEVVEEDVVAQGTQAAHLGEHEVLALREGAALLLLDGIHGAAELVGIGDGREVVVPVGGVHVGILAGDLVLVVADVVVAPADAYLGGDDVEVAGLLGEVHEAVVAPVHEADVGIDRGREGFEGALLGEVDVLFRQAAIDGLAQVGTGGAGDGDGCGDGSEYRIAILFHSALGD